MMYVSSFLYGKWHATSQQPPGQFGAPETIRSSKESSKNIYTSSGKNSKKKCVSLCTEQKENLRGLALESQIETSIYLVRGLMTLHQSFPLAFYTPLYEEENRQQDDLLSCLKRRMTGLFRERFDNDLAEGADGSFIFLAKQHFPNVQKIMD